MVSHGTVTGQRSLLTHGRAQYRTLHAVFHKRLGATPALSTAFINVTHVVFKANGRVLGGYIWGIIYGTVFQYQWNSGMAAVIQPSHVVLTKSCQTDPTMRIAIPLSVTRGSVWEVSCSPAMHIRSRLALKVNSVISLLSTDCQ